MSSFQFTLTQIQGCRAGSRLDHSAGSLFLCPSTGDRVQRWFADNGSEDGGEMGGEMYEWSDPLLLADRSNATPARLVRRCCRCAIIFMTKECEPECPGSWSTHISSPCRARSRATIAPVDDTWQRSLPISPPSTAFRCKNSRTE